MARASLRRPVFLIACLALAGAPMAVSAQAQEEDTYAVPKPKPVPQQPQGQPQSQPQQQTRQPAQPQQQTRPQQPPSQQQSQRPQQPQPPADVAERVLQRRLGSEGLQQALRQMETMSNAAASGRGAPMSDVWFDGSSRRTGDDNTVRGGNTPFFRGTPSQSQGAAPSQSAPSQARPQAQNAVPAPVTSGGYQRSTVQDAERTRGRYGSIPGGVVLEGVGSGIGKPKKVRYDGRFNAFILDERAAYFMAIPPKTVALLCRSIAQDDKVGVSLGQAHIVYGAVPPESDLAMDLKMADRFLGDIVFAGYEWTAGYRFANGYQPQANKAERFPVAVFFNLNRFEFQVQQEEVRLARSSLDVRLLPLSNAKSAQGGHLPDLDAIAKGRVSPQYEANAQHVAEQIAYYRRERIVERTFAYGEVAAFIRALKQAGIDLQALARSVPAGRGS